MKPERIQKVMSQSGVGSRRQIESWIREGRITVDGQPATIGQLVTRDQHFKLNGRSLRLRQKSPTRVLVLNKPEGYICSRKDPGGRKSVFELLPRTRHDRWVLVGRLDINTSGLLLVTNNGELANRLMHPSSEIEREYKVRVHGTATSEQLDQLLNGIELEDGMAAFSSITEGEGKGTNRWYNVVILEGRNREVRRMWEAVGLQVSRLIRVRYGLVALPRLTRGHYRNLPENQVTRLMQSVGLRQQKNHGGETDRSRNQHKTGGKAARNSERKPGSRQARKKPEQTRSRHSRKTARQPARRRSRQ
jgi:23S rRNA pseudouridine2605 synthase